MMNKTFAYVCAPTNHTTGFASGKLKEYSKTLFELGYVPICPCMMFSRFLIKDGKSVIRLVADGEYVAAALYGNEAEADIILDGGVVSLLQIAALAEAKIGEDSLALGVGI